MDINLILIFLLSLISAFIDISCGMGYGFTVTPILLLMGYTPEASVPAVLFSSFLGAALSSFFHQIMGNVDFRAGGDELKIGATLGGFGVIGGIIGARLSFNIPAFYLQTYIGLLVISAGVVVLTNRGIKLEFSWIRIAAVGILGSINKGLSGSGFGPIVTTGTIMSGMNEKASVAIQALSELPVSIIGFATYYLSGALIDWQLTTSLGVGVAIASPLATYFVKRVDAALIRKIIGVVALFIGSITLATLFF